MMVLTKLQKLFIIEHYSVSKSLKVVENKFMDAYPGTTMPYKSTISHIIKWFHNYSSLDKNYERKKKL